jgi:RimJ/RimL family protein N-acetyltransferase
MTRNLILRNTIEDDLPILFEQQLDPAANYMAAFTAKDPSDKDAFTSHWKKIMGDDSITKRTILFEGRVAGHIGSFQREGKLEVTYWIGKQYWGKGIATKALSEFLCDVRERPIYARVAKDNIASIRVLEKCKFKISGEDKGFSNARGKDVEEFILELRGEERDPVR